ncbi:unnamed protein product [Caenorhabditis nigoni]|uniref:Sdz-33 F-box domain-containing protein n=1 Tax=Caenorhabditis nigoni TaxID=1611254 RepID=A0A2G5T348_9PELO|nr:hypothetical protein B9Z55_026515 [Caenorhabditis nigoni]
MEERPEIFLYVGDSFIKFKLEMPSNNGMITNLDDHPVSVRVSEGNEERESESTMNWNQQMSLGEWIQHFRLLPNDPMSLHVQFYVGNIKFDIQSLRNTFPNLRRIGVTCLKEGLDESDILNAQNVLRAFLSDVQHLVLHCVPLQENLSLQHIGMTNLKELWVYYQKNLNFVDVAAWNAETCVITKTEDQMSIRDLNRFFKLWIEGSNPRLKEFSTYFGAEAIPDWNVLLKGLKSIEIEAEEEEGYEERKFTIQNNRGISAVLRVYYEQEMASVFFTLSN